MDFNLDHLKSFIVVARIGNLSKAAQELGTTQPNLGRQMTALSKETDLELFFRHSRGISLTKQGEDFLALCHDIVGRLAQGTDVIREKDSEPHGTLKVVTGVGTTEAIIKNLHLFSQKFPKIHFSFSSITDIYQFHIGDADIGFFPTSFSDPNLVQHHLSDMTLRIYAAPNYLKEHSTPKTLEDLKGHQQVVYAGENQEVLHQIIKDHTQNIYSRPFISVNNGINMRTALIEGLGIGTYFYDRELIEKNLLVDVFPDIPDRRVPYYFTYHRRLEGSPKIKVFYEFMKEITKGWDKPDIKLEPTNEIKEQTILEEMACKMLQKGMDAHSISDITGLSEERILKLLRG